jgi:hypothetical protein
MAQRIVKVQLPLAGSVGGLFLALVYDRDRQVDTLLDITDSLKKLMGEDVKAFFYADVDSQGGIKLGTRAPWQTW